MRFREFKERLRRRLIHKLGGFSILPPSEEQIIVRSTTVAPEKFVCKVFFGQQDLYDITPSDLEKAAKKKLRSKIADSVWLVDPRAMRKR